MSFWSLYLRRPVTFWQSCKLEVACMLLTDEGFDAYVARLGL